MSSLIKNIIVIVGLVALAGLGYYLFVVERGATLDTEGGTNVGQAQLETEEFIRRLKDIESITLSTEIFTNAKFNSLQDFSSVIDRVPVGRENPFATR